ncbi:hypothetical protein H6P81_019333 [Aristolochia fimbriata]|uniref:Uncharacterized protein n=1 Tax=Aristolochia fimbriata TaxID=158543 RepID=A0AAV7DS91_ARIFI|nr:hypothetical protein H6P81_019333 [Aristolochia fimbriata]
MGHPFVHTNKLLFKFQHLPAPAVLTLEGDPFSQANFAFAVDLKGTAYFLNNKGKEVDKIFTWGVLNMTIDGGEYEGKTNIKDAWIGSLTCGSRGGEWEMGGPACFI